MMATVLSMQASLFEFLTLVKLSIGSKANHSKSVIKLNRLKLFTFKFDVSQIMQTLDDKRGNTTLPIITSFHCQSGA